MLRNLPAKFKGSIFSCLSEKGANYIGKCKSQHRNVTVLVWKGCSELLTATTWFKLLIKPWIKGLISLWRGSARAKLSTSLFGQNTSTLLSWAVAATADLHPQGLVTGVSARGSSLPHQAITIEAAGRSDIVYVVAFYFLMHCIFPLWRIN